MFLFLDLGFGLFVVQDNIPIKRSEPRDHGMFLAEWCSTSLVVSMWYSDYLSALLLRSTCGGFIQEEEKCQPSVCLESSSFFLILILPPSLSEYLLHTLTLSLKVYLRKCRSEASPHAFAKLHKRPVKRQWSTSCGNLRLSTFLREQKSTCYRTLLNLTRESVCFPAVYYIQLLARHWFL